MKEISGSGVALVTPFDSKDKLNIDKLKELIEYQILNDTDFIVVAGTTGEASTLSKKERRDLVKYSVEFVSGRIPLIVGTGSNSTKTAIKQSIEAKSLGADGILVVTPYYNKGNEEGIYNHYKKIAEAVFPLPVILYNVPSRTGVDLSLNLIVKLSEISNIIGIKEASPSLEKIARIKATLPNFKVFSGNDNLVIPVLSLGGDGVISVFANIFPFIMHKICKEKNLDLFLDYLDLMNILFIDVNPIMIKEAMNYLKYNVGKVRLPLYHTDKSNICKLQTILKEKMRE